MTVFQSIAKITSVYHPDDYLPGDNGKYSAVIADYWHEREIYFDCLQDAVNFMSDHDIPYRMEDHLHHTSL